MKKSRKFTALLLALSVILGCSVNAFAALPEEEETLQPQQLIPVMMDAPPMGVASDYTTYDRYGSGTGSTNIGIKAREITPDFLEDVLGAELGLTVTLTVADFLFEQIVAHGYDPDSIVPNLYYTQTRYSSRYPGCYKVVRYYYTNSARTIPLGDGEPTVYYLMYV